MTFLYSKNKKFEYMIVLGSEYEKRQFKVRMITTST